MLPTLLFHFSQKLKKIQKVWLSKMQFWSCKSLVIILAFYNRNKAGNTFINKTQLTFAMLFQFGQACIWGNLRLMISFQVALSLNLIEFGDHSDNFWLQLLSEWVLLPRNNGKSNIELCILIGLKLIKVSIIKTLENHRIKFYSIFLKST